MGVCNSSPKKSRKNPNTAPGTDQFSEMRQKFQKEIMSNPFFSINTSSQQLSLISQFENSNQSPDNYINSDMKFTQTIKKQLVTVYLKSIPFLSRVYSEDEKQSHVFFFNLVVFMLSNGGAIERKFEVINSLLVESYDVSQKKYNIDKLRDILNSIVYICLFITCYFGGHAVFLDENNKTKIFAEEFYRIENQYGVNELDDYFIEQLSSIHGVVEKEQFIFLWEKFLMNPINTIIWPTETQNNNKERNYDNIFLNFSDGTKDDIRYRLCHMFESFTFFEIFIKKEVPEYIVSKYKSGK
jgi:hypothetical protein